MTKEIAVATTVGSQLHHEGHWPPNDLSKVMGNDYHYDINTLSNFFVAVQWNLKHGNPSFDFQFDNAFIASALNWDVTTVIGNAIANTN